MPRRLGIIPHAFAQPLFAGLGGAKGPAASAFDLVTESSAQLAIELRQGNLDGAFLSPVDYAREYTHYSLLPDAGVVSSGESGAILLLFGEGGARLKTIAVDPTSSAEIVLAHLVMAEKYDVVPKFVPVRSTPDEALKTADAVLVTGDAAVAMAGWDRKLDVVDEWEDAMGLPYIHGLWATRPDALHPEDIARLRRTGRDADARQGHAGHFHYALTPDDHAALTEFLRVAYYHGILKDIPDMKFLPDEPIAPFTAAH